MLPTRILATTTRSTARVAETDADRAAEETISAPTATVSPNAALTHLADGYRPAQAAAANRLLSSSAVPMPAPGTVQRRGPTIPPRMPTDHRSTLAGAAGELGGPADHPAEVSGTPDAAPGAVVTEADVTAEPAPLELSTESVEHGNRRYLGGGAVSAPALENSGPRREAVRRSGVEPREVDPLTSPQPEPADDLAAADAERAVAGVEAELEASTPVEGAERENPQAQEPAGPEQPPAVAAELPTAAASPDTEGAASDDVAAWQGRVQTAAATMSRPQPAPAGTYSKPIESVGGAGTQALRKKAEEIPLEAKKVLEARPLKPLPEAPGVPAPDPIPAATQRLKDLAVRKLPDQKLPKLIATPNGFLPNVAGPPVDTKVPPAPPPSPKTKKGARSKTPVKAVNETLAQGPPAPAPGEGQTLTGSERLPTPTIAEPHRADITKVLARVYLQAEGMGAEVLKDARATAYPKPLSGRLADLGKEQEEQEALWFRQELGRVAEAASIGKAALDAAVVERAKELEKGNQAHAVEVATATQEQVARATEAGARAQSMAEASFQAWERHFDSMAAQAKGGVDPTAVRAEEARIGEELRTFASTHTTAWAGIRKVRDRDLNRAREDQYTAYQQAAVADQEQREKKEPPPAPAKPAKAEPAKPAVTELTDPALQQWVKERRAEVDKAVLALRTDLAKTVDGWTTEMNKARDEGVETARKWADGRIGRERGWLESLIAEWLQGLMTKKQDNKAFEQAQTDETVAALGGTLQVINDLKLGGMEKLDRDGKDLLGQMTAEEQKLMQAYFTEGDAKGDTVLLLASMLAIRLRRQRKSSAQQYIRDKVLALDNVTYWKELDIIGAVQKPGFSAATIADQLWQAFEHTWGTDEDKAFAAVKGGLSLEQSKAVRGVYKASHNEDLDERMESELSGTDLQRVQYGFDDQQASADAAALADAMGRVFSNDQTLIRETLRNKTPEQRKAIADAYKRLYGKELVVDFARELRGDDRAIVDALWVGNKEKADAIEIKVAREGFWGPDHEKIEQVYTRVRDEATQDGDAKGWKTEQINAEIARRTGKMATEYAGYTKRGLMDDLEKSFNPPTDQIWDPAQREAAKQYWAGRRDLVMGLATGDLTRADAGKIQIERTGFYAKDETINKVLALQYSRAYDNARRDALVEFAAKHNGRGPNKEEMKELEKTAEQTAKKEGKASMGRLGSYFETNYTGGTESFRDTIIDLTQGVDEEKGVTLYDQGGFLEDWQVLEYATKGAGTDEDEFKRVIKKQKTKAEQDALQSIWQSKTGTTRTIKDLIHDETSGRLENDLLVDNDYGGEPDDPAVMVAKATAQLDFERRSGGESTYVDESGEVQTVKNHEYLVLEQRLEDLKAAAKEREQTKDLPDDDPRKMWAQARLDQGTQAFTSGIETHRFLVDQRTELAAQIVTMAVTIVAAVVITVATGGVGSFAGAALIAGAASLFGAAAGIATKMSMKGAAYGTDELGVDIALGVVDAVVSAATAGFGGKLLKGATAAAKTAGTTGRGVLVTLGRMAEGTTLKRAAAHAIAEGAEGFLQSLPTAVLGTALDEKTWTEGNPLFNMLAGVGMGVGMGTFASGTIGGLTNLRGPKSVHVPEPGNVPAIQGRLVDLVPGTAEHAHLEARYFELNPNRTHADFQRDLDGLVMLQAKYNPEVKARLEARLRDNIADLLPVSQKSVVADHPVEMWDTKRFEEFTGSKTGHAVVVVKDGRPTVIVKQGADPLEIAQEGFHLLQAADPKTRPKVARLDESVMSRWSSLDVREKLVLYKEKLDLELEAQRNVVAALEERAGRAVDDPGLAERLARARDTLDNLDKRARDMGRIGPFQRQLMAWGVLPQPPWLDQPARLFAKAPPATRPPPARSRKTTADTKRLAAPPEIVRQRQTVTDLRAQIEGLEARGRQRGGLSTNEAANLESLKNKLADQYAAVPTEGRRAQEAALFDRRPGESPSEYHQRLTAMQDEVYENVLARDNPDLWDRYEALVRRSAADAEELKNLRAKLADVQKRESAIAEKWNENMVARNRADPSQVSGLNVERAKLARELAALNAEAVKLNGLVDGIERRGSLFYADQVWKTIPLVDPTDPLIKSRIGLFGELDSVANLLDGGFETLGRTLDPRQVTSLDAFERALLSRRGQQDIDFIVSRERPGVTEYLLGDAKATADISPRAPEGAGRLKTMSSDPDIQQLGSDWLRGHLPDAALSDRDLRNITEALDEAIKNPGKPVRVVHPDGTVENVVVRRIYAQTFRDADGATRTRFREVVGDPVTLGDPFVP